MNLAPIVLFVYNRPWHTGQVIEALQKNDLADESELIIFSDDAKNEKDREKVEEVRNCLKSISGFKKVRVIERDKNFGLAQSIISGVTEVVNQYGKIIVLEDDLITSPYFLTFMNQGLTLYENNDRVISIHGYVYPVKGSLPETFFLKGADCWGWATWKRSWDLFESDGTKLLNELKQRKLTKEFDFNGVYPYTKMLVDQIKKKNDSWAIRWYASAFLKNKLTLYPGKSLVNNFGFDNSGVHSGIGNEYTADVYLLPIKVEKITVEHNLAVWKIIFAYFRSLKPGFIKLWLGRFRKIISLIKK